MFSRQKMLLVCFSIVSCLMLPCAIGYAEVLHVPADYQTIQQAIDAAVSGDEVVVAAGIYEEAVVMKEGVNLTGAGTSDTIIQSDGIVVQGANDSKITGFKLTGHSYGIYCQNVANLQVLDNLIDSLQETGWGYNSMVGIYLDNCSDINISNNKIGNVLETLWGYAAGISMYNSADVTVLKNVIYNIHESDWSGAYGIHISEGTRIEVYNNLIYHIVESAWDSAYGIYAKGSSNVILNNVIKYTLGTDWGGSFGIYSDGSGSKISNNIVEELYADSWWGNTWGIYDLGTNNDISYNNVWQVKTPYYGESEPISGPGNLNVEPMFVNTEDPALPENYILQTGSPCIDTGDPDPAYNDLDGTRNDMGIYGGAYTCIPPKDAEVSVFKYSTAARPGFNMDYSVIAGNIGTKTAKNVTLTDYLPPEVNYISSNPIGTYNSVTHSIYWDIGTLNGRTHQKLTITVNVPASTQLGVKLLNKAVITTTSPKDNPLNNTCVYVTTVIGSWDPNDKGVSPQGYIKSDDLLTYFVHFENKGTAEAINISVTDVLNENLDPENLLLISDNGQYNKNTRTITWNFENINLPPGGEGMVSFVTKAKPDISVGTEITNKASIIFDFNLPIETPEVVSIIGSPYELGLQSLINEMYLFKREMQMINIPDIQGFISKLQSAIEKVEAGLNYLHNGKTVLASNMLNAATNELNALINLIKAQSGAHLQGTIAEEWLNTTQTIIKGLQTVIKRHNRDQNDKEHS